MEDISRRNFLKLAGGALGGLFVAEQGIVNIASGGTLFAHVKSLFTGVKRDEENNLSDNGEIFYAEHSKELGHTKEFWVDSGVLKNLDTGLYLYYGKNLSDPGVFDTFIRISNSLSLDLDYLLPVMSYWSEHKITSEFMMNREKIVAIAQTELSAHVDLSSSLRSKLKGVLLLKPKGFIATRTVGFYDKGVKLYAKAIMESIDNGYISEEEWNSILSKDTDGYRMLSNYIELLILDRKREEYTEDNDTANTPYDEEYLILAQKLEKFTVNNSHDFIFGVYTTAVLIKRQEGIVNSNASELGLKWDFNNLNSDQYAMKLYWILVGSDYWNGVDFDKNFNTKLEADFFPADATIPSVMRQTVAQYPRIISQLYGDNFSDIRGEDIVNAMANDESVGNEFTVWYSNLISKLVHHMTCDI